MELITKKNLVLSMLISLSVLVIVFTSINPENKPLVYIFLPVVIGWIFLFSLLNLLIILIFREKTRLQGLLTFAVVSSSIILLLLSGIDQLTVRDVLLTAFLALTSAFYFYRSWA